MKILTINARPDTFESKLPDGVHGSLELLENLSVDNIKSIDIDNASDYEENMDAEYRIVFKNGDEIHFDGYSGLWALEQYDSPSVNKAAIVKDLLDVLLYNIEQIG